MYVDFVWRSKIRSRSLFRARSHGTIMEGATPYLGSVILILTMVDAYCMCHYINTSVDMKKTSANYIRFMACIPNGDVSLCLGISETSFVRSAISTFENSSTFSDLHLVQCARSLFRRQCHDQDERIRLAKVLGPFATQGSFGELFQMSRIIGASPALSSRNVSAIPTLVLAGWLRST